MRLNCTEFRSGSPRGRLMLKSRMPFWFTMAVLVLIALLVATIKFGQSAAPLRPLPVPPGDQEIAWFHTATNTFTWDRFVAGVHHAARQQPRLVVDDSRAFLDQTTGVPEVAISLQGGSQTLHIRWYKQTAEVKVADWITALARRDPPPIAIVGGGSSDRALELARDLARQKDWRGPPPLLLITTATANTVYVGGDNDSEDRVNLMGVYPGRTFRFCFTNRQMARAVLSFVAQQPELRPHGQPFASLASIAAASDGNVFSALACAATQSEFPPEVFALEWKDDPYSIDLSEQFRGQFYDVPADSEAGSNLQVSLDRTVRPQSLPIPSSVGGYLRPNRGEALALSLLLSDSPPFPLRSLPNDPLQRSLLILPAVPQPCARILAGLTGANPDLGHRLVAVSGDSISFNHVYRDGALVWNIRLVPVPLVFFAHQNPVAWDDDASPSSKKDIRFGLHPPDGTDDVLHFADVVRILADAAFDLKPSLTSKDELLSSSDELKTRLQRLEPPFFDEIGNRRGGEGEYVLYLRPQTSGGMLSATLEIWGHKRGFGWVPIHQPLKVNYK